MDDATFSGPVTATGVSPVEAAQGGPHHLAVPTGSRDAAIYLNDPAAVGGASVLLEQLRLASTCAARAHLTISSKMYYVDSGRLDGSPTVGASLLRLIDDTARGRVGFLIVGGLERFAAELAEANEIAAAIRKTGCVLLDASAPATRGTSRRRAVGRASS